MGDIMQTTFADAVRTCFSKYADFNGRAARPELWYFVLFVCLVHLVMRIIETIVPTIGHILIIVFLLGTIVPMLAVGARRLHDVDKSGWLQLIQIIPLIGIIALIYFWAQPGTAGDNRFG